MKRMRETLTESESMADLYDKYVPFSERCGNETEIFEPIITMDDLRTEPDLCFGDEINDYRYLIRYPAISTIPLLSRKTVKIIIDTLWNILYTKDNRTLITLYNEDDMITFIDLARSDRHDPIGYDRCLKMMSLFINSGAHIGMNVITKMETFVSWLFRQRQCAAIGAHGMAFVMADAINACRRDNPTDVESASDRFVDLITSKAKVFINASWCDPDNSIRERYVRAIVDLCKKHDTPIEYMEHYYYIDTACQTIAKTTHTPLDPLKEQIYSKLFSMVSSKRVEDYILECKAFEL